MDTTDINSNGTAGNHVPLPTPRLGGTAPVRLETGPGVYAYCPCGLSSSQPFCDDNCVGTEWKPVMVMVEEERKISWCTCKQSSKGHICDGHHKQLAINAPK